MSAMLSVKQVAEWFVQCDVIYILLKDTQNNVHYSFYYDVWILSVLKMYGHVKNQMSGYLWGEKEEKEFWDGRGGTQWTSTITNLQKEPE